MTNSLSASASKLRWLNLAILVENALIRQQLDARGAAVAPLANDKGDSPCGSRATYRYKVRESNGYTWAIVLFLHLLQTPIGKLRIRNHCRRLVPPCHLSCTWSWRRSLQSSCWSSRSGWLPAFCCCCFVAACDRGNQRTISVWWGCRTRARWLLLRRRLGRSRASAGLSLVGKVV